ncbi:hypothetical protein FIBSPDRAFT_901499 [Athelia psychrophila]|uniref:Uncharacterized protein n=1 Tax=Athelia psychrophila TaxID=1759441 RepID=A0A165X236_9AGAM|nr:hypothetical protein FIBSPDRAFT_901499 [Fibularhizoctonia sp. CBS 109695]
MGWTSGARMVGCECTRRGFTAAAKCVLDAGSRAASAASGRARKLVVCAVRAWGPGSGHGGCWVSRGHRGWVQARVEPDRVGRVAGYMRASMGNGCGLGAGCVHMWGLGADWARTGIGRGLEIGAGAGSTDASWMGAGGEHGCVRDMGGEARRGWVRNWPAQMRMWWKTGCGWGVCMRVRAGWGWRVSERETKFEPDQAHTSSKPKLPCVRRRKGGRGESEYSGIGRYWWGWKEGATKGTIRSDETMIRVWARWQCTGWRNFDALQQASALQTYQSSSSPCEPTLNLQHQYHAFVMNMFQRSDFSIASKWRIPNGSAIFCNNCQKKAAGGQKKSHHVKLTIIAKKKLLAILCSAIISNHVPLSTARWTTYPDLATPHAGWPVPERDEGPILLMVGPTMPPPNHADSWLASVILQGDILMCEHAAIECKMEIIHEKADGLIYQSPHTVVDQYIGYLNEHHTPEWTRRANKTFKFQQPRVAFMHIFLRLALNQWNLPVQGASANHGVGS